MCRDILDDKNIKLEMMNNINMSRQVEVIQQQEQQQQQPEVEMLPERVLEMYNMLLGITTELEKIKYELAKREGQLTVRGSNHLLSFQETKTQKLKMGTRQNFPPKICTNRLELTNFD